MRLAALAFLALLNLAAADAATVWRGATLIDGAQMMKLIVPSRMKAHPSDRRLFLKLRGSFPIEILPKVRRSTVGRGVRIVLPGDNGQHPEGPVARAACRIRR